MYQRSVLVVLNRATNRKTFFLEKCGVMCRIGQKEYETIRDDADGVASMFTQTTAQFIRQGTVYIADR